MRELGCYRSAARILPCHGKDTGSIPVGTATVSPSSNGLGHRLFKAAMRVRVLLGTPQNTQARDTMRQLPVRDRCMKLDKLFEYIVAGMFCGFGVFFVYWVCGLLDKL